MVRFSLVSSLFASVSLVGCGSVDDPMDVDDTTSPSITSVTPGNGQIGVAADTVIVIAFDERMDQASVEAAYASSELPAEAVTFAWNEAGDTLTIAPKQPLALAEGIGNDPSTVTAKQYALSLAATATDTAGNPIASPLDHAFKTFKRMETDTGTTAELTRWRTSSGSVASVGANMLIGDAGALTMRGFVTFDLSSLPGGAEIETAGFGVRQIAVSGDPFELGALDAVHVTYATVDEAAWNAPQLAMFAPLSTTAGTGPRTVDVTAAVADDYAHRVERMHRTQFRLQFALASDGDNVQDSVTLDPATFGMLITYLVP